MSAHDSAHVELCMWESAGVRLAIPSRHVRQFAAIAPRAPGDHDISLALGLGASPAGVRVVLEVGAQAVPCVLGAWVRLQNVAIASLRRLPLVVRERLAASGICGYVLDGPASEHIAYLVDLNALLSDAARKRA